MAGDVEDRMVLVGWRMPESMRWKIKELAAQRHTSAEKVLREVLRRYLAEERAKEEARR